ncbi:Glyco-hydro-79C domain-containing protein [Mycena kentingensis (nom. inval.)]|nr:Glyco-hydro-79C domain-containing protein [Mycena kentingensis (nom. inval.)]
MGLPRPGALRSLTAILLLLPSTLGEVTIYHAPGQAGPTNSAAASDYTSLQAFNPTTLTPPAVPTPAILTNIPVKLQKAGTPNLGVKQDGAFLGFSIEMSVSNQVFGKNSTFLQVPFLNLMASLAARAGSVRIRVGGNSQERAKLVDTIPDGRVLQKDLDGIAPGSTATPPIDYTADLVYMLGNISALVDVNWIIGLPWFVTKPFDLRIVPLAETVLGDHLLALQAANEPDMYVLHQHRVEPFTPYDYGGEVSDFLAQLAASGMDPSGSASKKLVAPNLGSFEQKPEFLPDNFWKTGFADTFNENLRYLSVEKYPVSNCGAVFHNGEKILIPQEVLPEFLNHTTHVQNLVAPFINSAMYAQSKNKPFLMMETSQASCGGLAGVSDTFGAALWTLDYALQMAHANFSGAFFHTGGVHVFYNPFTAPPTAESGFRGWSVGPMYYAALAMAEAIGKSGATQVLDLTGSIAGVSALTPVYGIYENGAPVRVAAFNYADDPTGATDATFAISVSEGGTPASVRIKRLSAQSVSQKGRYTWANQTLGGFFESDGRLMDGEVVETIQCDSARSVCEVKVPAPGFALVYLAGDVFGAGNGDGADPTVTFATTLRTKTHNTATVDAEVLATSNGHNGAIDGIGSTSRGKQSGARTLRETSIMLVATLVGVGLGAGMWLR